MTRLFLFLFAIFLITYSPTFHSSDGLAMFATAESLVRRGAWDIDQIRWMDLQQGTYGQDGLLYSRKGIGQPLLALPLTWLGLVIPQFGTATTTLLFGSIITALTGTLIFYYLRQLDYSENVSIIIALMYGTATLAWHYAKTFFSDTLAGMLLFITALALLKYYQHGRYRYLILGGLALAWAVATRYAEAMFVPIFGLILIAYQIQRSPTPVVFGRQKYGFCTPYLRPLIAFYMPIFIVGCGLLIFNYQRYGNPLNTGYLPQETFSAIWWQGILGQLISPGRGLLIYSPILILAFFGLRKFWQRHAPHSNHNLLNVRGKIETIIALAIILGHVLLYGKWFMWHGGFAWGARFMIATLPFWMIFIAPIISTSFTSNMKGFKNLSCLLLISLWLISFAFQIPTLALDFDMWQHYLEKTGLPLFAPITFWHPKYAPLLGMWQFINLDNLDVAWVKNGKIAIGLLALLVANMGINSWGLLKPSSKLGNTQLIIQVLMTMITTIMLLNHAHQSPPHELHRAFDKINTLHQIPLIYHTPEDSISISERYKGRGKVVGITSVEPDYLNQFIQMHDFVWWLSTYPHDIETYLQNHYGLAQKEKYDIYQVSLFARPNGRPRTVNIQFGKIISLQQIQLPADLQANMPLAVKLTWQSMSQIDKNYHVFLHLLNSQNEIISQTDAQPVHWQRPTTTWLPNEPVTDLHALWLDDLPPDTYTLICGLYLPETGERLPNINGDDFAELAKFVISMPLGQTPPLPYTGLFNASCRGGPYAHTIQGCLMLFFDKINWRVKACFDMKKQVLNSP